MKILANDGLEKEGEKIFEKKEIIVDTVKKTPDELLSCIKDYDGILVRSATKVTAQVIEAGKGMLKIIGRAGVGYDNVDVETATKYGIVVKIAPHGNTNGTAEHALALMMAVARNIPQAYETMQKGSWIKKPYEGVELSGKTLGIIGCGRIGRRLSELVKGFDMNVIGYDPYPSNDFTGIKYVSTIDDVLKEADFISIHAGGKTTLIGEHELSLMKPNSYIVNASRGKNIDEAALRKALEDKKIAGAGLDVYALEGKEGKEFIHPYSGLSNVVVVPHLGASTKEAQRKTAVEIATVVSEYLLKGDWTNAVNANKDVLGEGKTVYTLFVTHQDIPGMFAKMDKIIADNGVNIRDNPSRQIGINGAAQTVYQLHQEPTEDLKTSLREVEGVYFVR